LTLRRNSLATLPEKLGTLISLTKLDLYENKLISLPNPIARVKSLVNLNVGKNLLFTLPEWLKLLPKLHYLFLNDNPMPKEWQSKIQYSSGLDQYFSYPDRWLNKCRENETLDIFDLTHPLLSCHGSYLLSKLKDIKTPVARELEMEIQNVTKDLQDLARIYVKKKKLEGSTSLSDIPCENHDFSGDFTDFQKAKLVSCASPSILEYLQAQLPPKDPVVQNILSLRAKPMKMMKYSLL
ncbi:MAG: leucine-rich repeat domain-containing protein, partial [Promethearchaeota archaeon]